VGLQPAPRMDVVNAAALGSAQDQLVGLLVFSRMSAPPDAGPQFVGSANLLRMLRPVGEVPGKCSVAGTLEAWPHRSTRRTSPAVVGRLLMGGDQATLFKGSIVKLGSSPGRWRVLSFAEGEDLELVAGRGSECSQDARDCKV
jgi:hypothetical protein